ncbi:ATP-binding protein [Streptomyces sp. KL116D]|uniref:ATP-binding protein n=1 Tax=Streptomyces sp. KL116D TaxID=3045152 RepID=UPI003557FA7E
MIGDLGGGKSVLQKTVQSAVVDRGARAICIDRTPVREWATFARGSAPGRCQVIDAAQAELSIDPLRLFPGPEGRQYALNYLTLQLGLGAMSIQGEVLHHAVEQAAALPDASMAKVMDALTQSAAAVRAHAPMRPPRWPGCCAWSPATRWPGWCSTRRCRSPG